MEIPEGARTIIDVLARRGKEAYLVGGCVRDALLGRRPSDYDITTSATPQEWLDRMCSLLRERVPDNNDNNSAAAVWVEC